MTSFNLADYQGQSDLHLASLLLDLDQHTSLKSWPEFDPGELEATVADYQQQRPENLVTLAQVIARTQAIAEICEAQPDWPHLLLSLGDLHPDLVQNVFGLLNLSPEMLFQDVERELGKTPRELSLIGGGRTLTIFDRMTIYAKHVVEHAANFMDAEEHQFCSTDHLLMGLLQEQGGIAIQYLQLIGLDLDDADELNQLRADLAPETKVNTSQALSQQLAHALEFALRHADQNHKSLVTNCDLLLGLLNTECRAKQLIKHYHWPFDDLLSELETVSNHFNRLDLDSAPND